MAIAATPTPKTPLSKLPALRARVPSPNCAETSAAPTSQASLQPNTSILFLLRIAVKQQWVDERLRSRLSRMTETARCKCKASRGLGRQPGGALCDKILDPAAAHESNEPGHRTLHGILANTSPLGRFSSEKVVYSRRPMNSPSSALSTWLLSFSDTTRSSTSTHPEISTRP